VNGGISSASYLQRWRRLSRPAWLYLLHAALLTSGLAVSSLFFNLAILALGYDRLFLGVLNTVSIAVAALLSLPLWWLAARMGLRRALLTSAAFNAVSLLLFALWPAAVPLLLASALTGVAAVLFQVSSPPFMMRHSDPGERDHLFSANAAINIGFAGMGSMVAGGLPVLLGRALGVGAESGLAYRATFAVAGIGLLLSLVPLLPIRERRAEVRAGKTGGQSVVRSPQSAVRRVQLASRITYHALLERIPEPWRGLLRRPGPVIRLLIPPFLISWGAALLIPYLNLFFKEQFLVADTTLGRIFAALGVATGLAALAGPAISARIGKVRTVVVTQALSIPFLLALGFVPLLGVAVAAALARGALFNMGTPLYDAFAMEQTDEPARPTVIGLINGAYSAGYLVAPLISTWVQAHYGFAPLFVATAACYGLAVLANYWFFVRGAIAGPGQEVLREMVC
jgi:MFS family permease